MITPNGRGVIAGGEEASKQERVHLSADQIVSVAHRVYLSMRLAGYAHIDTEDNFIEGFLTGFKNARSTS